MKPLNQKQKINLLILVVLLMIGIGFYYRSTQEVETFQATPSQVPLVEKDESSSTKEEKEEPRKIAVWYKLRQDSLYSMNSIVAKDGKLVAASYSGVFLSEDGGKNWIQTLTQPCRDLRLASNGHLYVIRKRETFNEQSAEWHGELWESADFKTWELLRLPKKLSGVDYYAVNPSHGYYYVASAGDQYVYRVPFSAMTDIQKGHLHEPVTGIETTENGLVYTSAGRHLYRSTDFGLHYQKVAETITRMDKGREFTLQSKGDKLYIESNNHIHVIDEKGLPAGVFNNASIAGRHYLHYSDIYHILPDRSILLYDEGQRAILRLNGSSAWVVASVPVEVGKPTGLYFDQQQVKLYMATEGTEMTPLFKYATYQEGLYDHYILSSKGSILRLDVEMDDKSGNEDALTLNQNQL